MWRWVGDGALQREFDGSLEDANRVAHAHARRLRGLPGVLDAYPAARSVTVVLAAGCEPSAALIAEIERDVESINDAGAFPDEQTIDVSYGGTDGPDLTDVAAMCGLTEAEVVRAHAGAEYRPAFFGFMPGFAYLLGLPAALRVPRLATPRTVVPEGSVAVAGPYSAVYPSATPGGWRIIGRAKVMLFDAARASPALLAGTRIRFRAVR